MSALTGVSFAFPEISASERARLADLASGAQDVFVLSTCLRVEIAWAGDVGATSSMLDALNGGRALPKPRVRTDFEAFHHLARVAAGLESAQLGETEVLTQFRQAFGDFATNHPDVGELSRVLETAVGIARSARRSFVAEEGGSLATAAAAMTGSASRVAILGGGVMARAVADVLVAPEVAVFARSHGVVAGIETRPWSEVADTLEVSDAVVSTVPGPIPVPGFAEAVGRRGRPLLFVDLGMPPALASPKRVQGLDYRDVDDVAASIAAVADPGVDEMVLKESETAWRRLTVSPQAASIISSVLDRAEDTVDEEVRRFSHRLASSPDPETVLRQLAHTVARRIVHPSVSYIGSTPLDPGELDVVARVFGVADD